MWIWTGFLKTFGPLGPIQAKLIHIMLVSSVGWLVLCPQQTANLAQVRGMENST